MIKIELEGDAIERSTAAKMTKLCGLRGVQAEVTWDGSQYRANGEACGRSIHGVYAWLEKQLGAKP